MPVQLEETDLVLEEDADRPTVVFTCLDTNGAAISLSGATLKLVVYDRDGVAVITLTGASLVVSGTDSNIVTATFTAANMANSGVFRYQLRRTAPTNLPLFRGAFTIRRGPQITW